MALQYRKQVRDKILALLAAGFNSTLSGMASTYGLSALPVIDFSSASTNFAVTYIDPANIEDCQIKWSEEMFLGGCLYTSDALDVGDPHGMTFAGRLFAHVDFFVRIREGAEGFDTESLFDAVEDTVLTLLNNPANQWPAGVLFERKSEMQRGPLVPLGDGFAMRIPVKTLFNVYVN